MNQRLLTILCSGLVLTAFFSLRSSPPAPAPGKEAPGQQPALAFPIIADYGGIVVLPKAIDPPRAGSKVVLDVTADSKPEDLNKGLERVARLLNLYGAAGLKANDARVAVVLHGDATQCALHDTAYRTRFGIAKNPNLPLIQILKAHGVQVSVCGQAVFNKGFQMSEVAPDLSVATSAMTLLINRQAEGYAYVPVE